MSNTDTSWNFEATKALDKMQFVDLYAQRIDEITIEAFDGKFGLKKRKLLNLLKTSTFVGIYKDNTTLQGFCFLSTPDTLPLQGKKLIWVDKIALSKNAQGKGLIAKLIIDLKSLFPNQDLGWVGCCTQNSTLIKSFSNMGKSTFPLTSIYGSEEGIGPWTYLTLNVKQLAKRLKGNLKELDIKLLSKYGILKGGYSKNINVSKIELKPELNEVLNNMSFEPENGDCLFLLSEL